MAVKLGVTVANQTRFENALGEPVKLVRQYCQGQIPPAGPWANVTSLSGLGYEVCVSFNLGLKDWTLIANGSDDALWIAIGNYLNGLPTPGIFCWHHEPEYQGRSYVGFAAALEHVNNIIKPRAPAWKSSLILMDYSFQLWRQNGSRNPNNYWPASGVDMVGIDFYDNRGVKDGSAGPSYATTGSAHYAASNMHYPMDWAETKGVPTFVAEIGSAIEDPLIVPNGWTSQRDWWQSWADAWRDDARLYGVMHFEHDRSDSTFPNRAISGGHDPMHPETMAAYRDMSIPSVVVPPPSGYVPGSIPVSVRARMTGA